MSKDRIKELARKYLDGTASQQEINELHEWYDGWEDDAEPVVLKADETENEIRKRILGLLKGKIEFESGPYHYNRFVLKRKYFVAAAVITIVFAASAIFFTRHGTRRSDYISKATPKVYDVAPPQKARATIVLADGKQVVLDGHSNGILAKQGDVSLLKTGDGQIVYQGKSGNLTQYNTLYNPRGSRVVSINLSDGTRVWLNAESSLKYPVAFTGSERKVEIAGEAYFEVAHDATKPFRVRKGDMEVTVLGTHFNVNTYDDEDNSQVTLLEGSVKVNKAASLCIIKPGQQARIGTDLKVVDNVNLEEVMAWKNGKFQFGDAADIRTIMRQIARWYDLDVEYRGIITDHIGGTISRDLNVSEVFRKLELTGVVNFQINNRKVIVMPK